MSDRQVINYLIKYYNLRRLRDWKKQKWDNSEKNNKVIQGLQHIREELDILDILKSGFVKEGNIITYKGYNNENWDKIEEWLKDDK